MTHTRSAKKRIWTTLEKSRRNRSMRSQSRTYVGKADKSIRAGDFALAEEAVKHAISILDKTARKGAIHRNTAARRKSSLMRKLMTARGISSTPGAP